MEARIDPVLLWSRAAGVGLVGFLLGTIGHVLADGLLPGPLTLTALLVFCVLISAPLLARPASMPRLALMVVGGQTMVHLALTVTAGHRGDAPGATSSATPAIGADAAPTLPVLDGHRVGTLQDAYRGVIATPGSDAPALPIGHLVNDLHAHEGMMLAHLVAAALVGLWLGYGERCLWTLLCLTGRQVTAALTLARPAPPAPRPHTSRTTSTDGTTTWRPVSRWRSQPRSRRGPPLPAC